MQTKGKVFPGLFHRRKTTTDLIDVDMKQLKERKESSQHFTILIFFLWKKLLPIEGVTRTIPPMQSTQHFTILIYLFFL